MEEQEDSDRYFKTLIKTSAFLTVVPFRIHV